MKQLLILSGKGGTGKTMITAAFIKLSEAKAYADCDVDAPNLHLTTDWTVKPKRTAYFGLPRAEIDPDLCTSCDLCREYCRFFAITVAGNYRVDPLACEGCGVCEFVCPAKAIRLKPHVDGENMLYVDGEEVFSTARLNMGSGTSGLLVTKVKKAMREAAGETKLAIIDGSPGIGCPVIASLSGVDLVMVVAEPSLSGLSDMKRVIETARRFGITTALCVNQYDVNLPNTRSMEDYCQAHGIIVVGRIPFDSQVVKAMNQGRSIVEIDCKAGEAVRAVYEKTIDVLMRQIN
ncbi:MAG: 4Fe-4S binding protein [Firmicutes bacterium]|nr:4Fe-4S binding protein [Bacillota bacterium]